METTTFLLHLVFGLVIAGLSAFVTAMLIRHIKAFDVPNERSSHTAVTPRGGGIAIVSAFLVAILIVHLVGHTVPIHAPYFFGFLFSSFVIAVLSFYDDFHIVSFKVKLGGQIIAIIVGLYSGIVIDVLHLPFLGEVYIGIWAYPLTFLWILGLTNAYNFIDGLDGLAASTAVIAAVFFSYISFQQGSHFIYLASMALAAASFGFLIFNWSPARIFMGDVGSTFLGLVFAVMAVIAARYDHSHTSLFVVPLLLFHFVFDTIFTFFRRMFAGEHVFSAHRSHLYQLLNRLGYSHKQVALVYSAMALCQGFAAVWMVKSLGVERIYVFAPFLIGYCIYAKVVIVKARRNGIDI